MNQLQKNKNVFKTKGRNNIGKKSNNGATSGVQAKTGVTRELTGCPKSSFLYFVSLYFSTIGLGKQIISTKVVSFNIIHYFHTCCPIF